MVLNILYVIKSPNTVTQLCEELATAIVENKASGVQVALLIVARDSSEYVQKLEKLSVSLIEEIRVNALDTFERLKELPEEKHSSFDLFVKEAESIAESLAEPLNMLVVCGENETKKSIRFYKNTSEKDIPWDYIGSGKPEQISPRSVKAMKAFDGVFTVGDPKDPLLSIPVAFYPVTRHSTPIDLASYVDGRRVVQSSVLKTESGAAIDTNALEKGYTYLNELVTADKGVQGLMNGEFNGAEHWNKAFELLATVPRIPPWIPLERTDVIVGKTKAATQFLVSFRAALEESKMHAIARLCRDPRRGEDGQLKHKGKLELVTIQPGGHDQLLCSPLPFREDYKYYYRFYELPGEPEDGEEDLDEDMDDIVEAMTIKTLPKPRRNALIERVAHYVRDKIAYGEAEIPPVPTSELPERKFPGDLKEKSMSLMSKFGVVERVGPGNKDPATGHTTGKDTDWDFDFV